jgi:nicotinate-nucleotide adenylyltransferase
MTAAARIGILGGTFDPVHVGHVETARAAAAALALDGVLVLPSGTPPHRQPPAVSRYHRFAMAALAATGVEPLRVSDLEIGEEAPSYSFDTLARLHARGLAPLQIFFITGADAFAEIATWSRYPQVLDLAHFVVVSRPGFRSSDLRKVLPSLASRMSVADDMSGSEGERLPGEPRRVEGPRIFLVDASTPDVSSTEIRRRLAAGASIAGLVPESVNVYINQHGLYARNGASLFGRSLA